MAEGDRLSFGYQLRLIPTVNQIDNQWGPDGIPDEKSDESRNTAPSPKTKNDAPVKTSAFSNITIMISYALTSKPRYLAV